MRSPGSAVAEVDAAGVLDEDVEAGAGAMRWTESKVLVEAAVEGALEFSLM